MPTERRVIETVLCFIKDADANFLMLLRGRKTGDALKGKFNAPGGKLEQGESPIDAMQREVQEETGLRVTEFKRLGFLSFPGFHQNAAGSVDESMHIFLITGWKGEQLAECAEGSLHWIPAGQLLGLPLWEGDRAFLPWVIEGRMFEGKLIYQQGKFISADIYPI